MSRFAGFLLLFVGFLLTSCGEPTPSLEPPPLKTSWTKSELDEMNVYAIAGDYYETYLGVSGNKITGVYRDPSAAGSKACWFFFEGALGTQNPIEVTCYQPTTTGAPFKGNFKILGEAIIMKLKQAPQDNCSHEFTDGGGRSVVLDLQHEWSAVRIVQHRAKLYDVPKLESPPRAIELPRGTAVAVVKRQNSWLLVDVLSQAGMQVWIQEHQLYPLLS
jgi:hypothetical protein